MTIHALQRALLGAFHMPTADARLEVVSSSALRRVRRDLRRALAYHGLSGRDGAVAELTDYFSQIDCFPSLAEEEDANPTAENVPAGPDSANQTTIDMTAALLFHAHEQATSLQPSPALVAAAWLRSRPGRDLRHLELGSGIGVLTQLLTGRGWSSTIAEISTEILDFARYRLQGRTVAAAFLDLRSEDPLPDTFDVVTVFDVLDRVPDPTAILRLLHDAMASEAVLLTESALCTGDALQPAMADAGLVIDAHLAGGATVLRRQSGIPRQRSRPRI